ncbi:hypothetical protein [Ralstonia phage RP31]|uniref:Uncharacterized protein n=2 Tax=Ripduovirus RP12 TaxID=2560700 RepID=A0A1L7N135_9CAUD|nr:hypothetical protein FDH28_gp207 [Ralstonia phage RP12]BAW19188.1 hypothetical protein [Ralstonia phage RP12]BAW19474.1 hypothetical protein [Ralstonia phage RP31]
MQHHYHTTPLIPWIEGNNKKFFMHVNGEPYSTAQSVKFYREPEEVTGDIGVLTLGAQISLLEVSERKDLLEQGVIDQTDSIAPDVYLSALYLTRPGHPVLRAVPRVASADKVAFQKPERTKGHQRGRPAAGAERRIDEGILLIRGTVPFALVLETEEGPQELEFEVDLSGSMHLETGTIFLNDNKEPGKELRITRQSVWCIRNQPLLGHKPAGYDILAGRINYNRRMYA